MILDFCCPRCDSVRIEEIMIDVTVSMECVVCVDDDDMEIDYNTVNTTHENGYIDRYQCLMCGFIILDSNIEEEALCCETLAKALRNLQEGTQTDGM